MLSKEMAGLGKKRSVIREIFEYGKKRAAEIGAENIFDFSLGNPSVQAPACVKEVLDDLINNYDSVKLHGYTSAQGDLGVRKTIADYLNKTHGAAMSADYIYMTTGAAAALCICFKAMSLPGDEFIAFAPYFTEYKVFVEASGGKLVVVSPDEKDFQIDIEKFEGAVTPKTKAVIVNSPNNPSGVVYNEKTVKALCSVLEKKSEEYAHPIYLIADEPYRELVYDGIKVPYLPNYYKNTIVCYSYSKSLSLPGERIGYAAVNGLMEDKDEMYAAICGAGRALGYVCASSMYQLVAAKCCGKTADISIYKENRDLLYSSLTEYGFKCVRPDGAFYLFVKSPVDNAAEFCEAAKKYELLLVPGDDFGCPGYVRIAYCVNTKLIKDALPSFRKLAKDYFN